MATNNSDKIVYIPLENVESEHCAMIVNKGLSEIPEISEHQVELNNRRAKIFSKNPDEVIPLAVRKIRDLGYDVPTIKKRYPLLNMSCASCASSSQNILKMQPGVVNANVNYANTEAEIEFIPSITDAYKLKSALQSVGYDLMIDESEEAKENLEEIQKNKSIQLRKKTFWAIGLSIPLMIIGMFFMEMPYANYIMWALATPIVFIFGKQFFIGAWKQLKNKSSNMDTLVAMSTGIAYVFSVFNTVFPGFWYARGLHPHVYFESAGVVIAFVLLGKLLEERAKGNTSSAIKKLIGMRPKSVIVIGENGAQNEMLIASIQTGNIILVKPGEKIAVDGKVISGNSFVDESMISGEPVAVEKKSGNTVFAGTLNQKGSFQFEATKVGSDTLLSQIIKMVQDAQGSKAPVQKLVDKIASVFVPVVLVISIITLIAWIVLGGQNGFTQGLLSMITVLVIACPCALGLATPTAIMVGVGKGTEHGILIKDAESLELAQKIDVVVLDKTGTITEGRPIVNDMKWFHSDSDSDKFKSILYSIEKQSEHPLAEAIVNYLTVYHSEERGISTDDRFPASQSSTRNDNLYLNGIQIENESGKGIRGIYENENYFVGNLKFIQNQNLELNTEIQNWFDNELNQARTVILFSNSKEILAGISISDSIKDSSKEAIQRLQDSGIEVYMQTGDNESTAKSVAEQVGIKHFRAGVLPEDKVNFIKELQSQGKIVAMVGDGINDSAALAQSNVGIAMGKGSDIAIESAKMTILSNDLFKIPEAIKLSKQTVSTIKQNLFWAFIYNVIGIPIAAGLLYPINGFLLNPMLAGAAMALSSVSVVSNSLRLKWRK